MRAYAHWLDGDYRKVLTGVTVENPTSPHDALAKRVIKTYALFGGSFVLSDSQIVDSPVLWDLFSQADFRKFLLFNTDFLQLKAAPVDPSKDDRWSIVAAGMERAIKAGHIGSPIQNQGYVIRLFDHILTAGPNTDLDEILHTKHDSPDSDTINGFISTLAHFRSSASVVSKRLVKPDHNLYKMLELASINPEIPEVDRLHLEHTVSLIKELLPDDEEGRTKRAVIHRHLDLSDRQHAAAWRTIVQAWNVAAQKSICPLGGSIGNVPNSVPVGAYVDQTSHVMFTGDVAQSSAAERIVETLIPEIPFCWNPDDLSWSELSRITNDEACQKARRDIREAEACGDRELLVESLIQLANAIAPIAKGKVQIPERWWIWALGGVLLRFGPPGAPMLGAALYAVQASERIKAWTINELRRQVIAAGVIDAAGKIGMHDGSLTKNIS